MFLFKFQGLFSKANLCITCSNRYFQNGFKPSHKIECLDHLVTILHQNVIYFDKDLLVLNKPYGLKKKPQVLGTPPGFIKLNPVAASLDEFSLLDTIPFLCEMYNLPKLTVVKCPDRYMSGLTILASSDKVIAKFDKCIRRARSNFSFPKYQAVCVGTPKIKEKQHIVGIVMETRKEHRAIVDKFKEKKMVFVNTWSKNELKHSDVNLLRLHHKVLAVSTDESASLIEVSSSWNKAHCVRIFLAAQLLTPVLGDHIHSSRVRYVFDKPVVGDLWNVGPQQQCLPAKLKNKLKISHKNEELTIPEHIHFSELVLPGYYKKDEDLVLTSHISSSSAFQYALDRLELLEVNVESENEKKDETSEQSFAL